jgi:hypothetical protein
MSVIGLRLILLASVLAIGCAESGDGVAEPRRQNAEAPPKQSSAWADASVDADDASPAAPTLACDPRFVLDPASPSAGSLFNLSFTDQTGWTWVALDVEGPGSPKATALSIQGQGPFTWRWTISGALAGVHTASFWRDRTEHAPGVALAFCQLLVNAEGSSPPSAGPAPDPLSPGNDDVEQHPERSLLVNTTFDAGFDGSGAPSGWSVFLSGDCAAAQETGLEKFGAAGVRIDGQGDFRAGLLQKVEGLTPNRWYHAFYATAQKVWGPGGVVDGALPTVREVGIDPGGGTDPNALGVIWGQRASGGAADAAKQEYGGWKTLGNQRSPLLTFLASSTSVTFFVRVSGTSNVENSNTWIDSAFLVEDQS